MEPREAQIKKQALAFLQGAIDRATEWWKQSIEAAQIEVTEEMPVTRTLPRLHTIDLSLLIPFPPGRQDLARLVTECETMVVMKQLCQLVHHEIITAHPPRYLPFLPFL